jgi:hypothetical protein
LRFLAICCDPTHAIGAAERKNFFELNQPRATDSLQISAAAGAASALADPFTQNLDASIPDSLTGPVRIKETSRVHSRGYRSFSSG